MLSIRPLTYVFGIQRSGTTWLGNALAAGTRSRYVHEPFNFRRHPKCKKYWLRHLPATADDETFLQIIRRAVRPQDLRQRLFRRRAVVKDVHIWTAVPFVNRTLQPRIILCVRHPCAVAASWARLEYSARSLRRLLSDASLVNRYLADFTTHMQRSDNYFFQLGAFWGAAYYILAEMATDHPEWVWVTHEALCRDPHGQYEALAAWLGLKFTKRGHHFLEKHDHRGNDSKRPYSGVRPTARQPEKWRLQLSPRQQQAVLEGTAPFGVFNTWYDERA